jgi:NADPH-dependent curcumin reductase CurA
VRVGSEWQLARRPQGWPVPDDFRLVEAPVRAPEDGEVLIRNVVMSVDPYMRGRMNEGPSYAAAYELDRPMLGGAIGRVVESRVAGVVPGSFVRHRLGWREWATVPAGEVELVEPERDGVEPSAYLGVLGMTGLTAWVGLYDIARIRPGETIFISAAAGAVGAIAGQLARLAGLRVVGSAGTPRKVYTLRELGFDAAFDYTAGDPTVLLREAAPEGIDCYFDNVGGAHLEAALECLNPFGRIAACGMVSAYNEAVPAPQNLLMVVSKKLTMRGFIVGDHADRVPVFRRHVAALLRAGAIDARETRRQGIEAAPEALLDVLRGGRHTGKMVVDL